MALKIHILGLGGVGKLIANYLPASPLAPTVTLLLHRARLASQWRENGSCIEVITKGVSTKQSKLQIEEIHPGAKQEKSVIKNLIVATKTHTTSAALSPLKHRLTADSTIVFLQNGMGTIGEVNDVLFPIASDRPQFIAGVVNHGVAQTSAFSVKHHVPSQMRLGLAPTLGKDAPRQMLTPASRSFLDCLCSAPVLNTTVTSPDQILFIQLQKLAVNAVINPLTGLLGCRNGELYAQLAETTLIKDLIAEMATVLQSYLHESSSGSQADSALLEQLSAKSLEATVSNAASITAANTSSMCQDMLAGKKTEVDYINGWIAARGMDMGKDTHINERIVDLVRREQRLTADQLAKQLLST